MDAVDRKILNALKFARTVDAFVILATYQTDLLPVLSSQQNRV